MELVGGEEGAEDDIEEKDDEAEEKGEGWEAEKGPKDGREEGRGGGKRPIGSVEAMMDGEEM